MIKKIQKYLLIHCPMLWNIRIVPMLLIITGLNVLFFGIQYFATDTGFENSAYFYNYFLMSFFSGMTGCLILIVWLYFYNHNNALKSFYPRTAAQLYAEWLLIFIIVTGAALLPFSVKKGYDAKWKSAAGLEETEAACRLLKKIDMLIPGSDNSYEISECFDPIPIPDSLKTKLDPNSVSLNLYSYTVKNNKIELTGYVGPSLLFYLNYSRGDIPCMTPSELEEVTPDLTNTEIIKKWLLEGQADSLLVMMTEFNRLQQKHRLAGSLTPGQWLERIYRPPFFSVDSTSFIGENAEDIYHDEAYIVHKHKTYLPYRSLTNGYAELSSVYNSAENNRTFLLTVLCFSIFISMMIYSYRVTSGRSWLFALIAAATLLFMNVLIAMLLLKYSSDEVLSVIFYLLWVALFLFLLVWVLGKIRNSSDKGKSPIYMNILLWLVPCVIPLVFFAYGLFRYDSSCFERFNYVDYTPLMFWSNLIIVVLVMGFVAGLIRRWKSLADE